ncbi:MAG: hypothetical protein ABIP16_09160 [Thermomonas sp.]
MNTVTGLLPGLVLCALMLGACSCDRDRPASDVDATGLDTEPFATPSDEMAPPPPVRPQKREAVTVKPDSGQSFTDLDKNMDSGVSRDELSPTEMLYQHFNEADTSHNGVLSYAEIERHRMDMTLEPQVMITDGRSIFQMDKNGDGGVSHDELWNNEMLYRHFDEADRDRDGKLSASEIDAHRTAMGSGN